MNPLLEELRKQLLSSGFRELAGARVSADVPLTDEWLNEVIAAWIASGPGPVREARLRTGAGDRVELHIRLTKFSFVPLTVRLFIERQPEFPASPILVIRWAIVSVGFTAFASRVLDFAEKLPPGIIVSGDRLMFDLAALLQRRGLEWVVPMVQHVQVATEPGRVLLHVTLAVPPGGGNPATNRAVPDA